MQLVSEGSVECTVYYPGRRQITMKMPKAQYVAAKHGDEKALKQIRIRYVKSIKLQFKPELSKMVVEGPVVDGI